MAYSSQGTFTITWTYDDGNGNTSTQVQTVIVDDVTAPTIVCPTDITVNSDAGVCGAIVSYTAPTGSDNCSGSTTTQTGGLGSGSSFSVGITTETYTVTDIGSNSASCSFLVTVEDNEAPTAICQDITVQLVGGTVTINPGDVDNGSNDACGIATTSVAPNTFTTADVGANTVTLTVTDVNGNISTCTATVTVENNEPPEITCLGDIVQTADSGECTANVIVPAPTVTGTCTIASITNDFTATDDASGIYPVGTTTVTWTVIDECGNQASCSHSVTVTDDEAPVAACQDITVELDASGNGTITANDVDDGSSDNCGISSLAVDPDTFTCADIGDNTVTLTVTDINGNVSACTSTVTVEGSAVATTIDFEFDSLGGAISTGQIIDNEFSNYGVTITTNDPVNHPAMIFDSAYPTGGDHDLGTPNEDFGGPRIGTGGSSGAAGENSVGLDNVLIISEDGDANDPDDNAGGGTITFTFDQSVRVDSLEVLDIDETHGCDVSILSIIFVYFLARV